MAKTWTPDGWKEYGNTNIWKLEEEIDEIYKAYYASRAEIEAEAFICDAVELGYIDNDEADYLRIYNERMYEKAFDYDYLTDLYEGE